MSSFYAMFDDFKEHLKIQNYILTKKQREKKFTTTIYCKEENVDVKKELDYMIFLFLKHNLTIKHNFYPFEVTEIISLRRDYFSTFVFSCSREQ